MRRVSQAEWVHQDNQGSVARRVSVERRVMKAPRVKQACLANLETGAHGGCLDTVAPLERRANSETQVLKAEMAFPEHLAPRVTVGSRAPLDSQDELWMWGLEERERRVRRGMLGIRARMEQRGPRVRVAPPDCRE